MVRGFPSDSAARYQIQMHSAATVVVLGAMVVLAATAIYATEYTVEFDRGLVGGVNGNVVRAHLGPSSWTTVGHARGSTLENLTGDRIGAIWMKVPRGDHEFRLGSIGGGSAFDRVWRKKDGSELLFLGGDIPYGSLFWSRVVPRNLANPFQGQAFHVGQDPPTPDSDEWDLVYDVSDQQKEEERLSFAWKRFLERATLDPGSIRSYAAVEETNLLVFLSDRGFPYVFDALNKQFHPVSVDQTYPADADRISASVGDKGAIKIAIHRRGVTVAEGTWMPMERIEAKLPPQFSKERVQRIYFAGPNMFDLEAGRFLFTLFDAPAALAIRADAKFLRQDDKYYYYESEGFTPGQTIEWAFTIQPSDSFDGHRVLRKWGSDEWQEVHDSVYMTFPFRQDASREEMDGEPR